MAGCSVVLLALVWPVFLLGMLVVAFFGAIALWVSGPAFPWFVGSVVCGMAALATLVRAGWLRFRRREDYPLRASVFVLPALLSVLAGIAFVVMLVLTKEQALEWWATVQAS